MGAGIRTRESGGSGKRDSVPFCARDKGFVVPRWLFLQQEPAVTSARLFVVSLDQRYRFRLISSYLDDRISAAC